jgi:hypothetical protein
VLAAKVISSLTRTSVFRVYFGAPSRDFYSRAKRILQKSLLHPLSAASILKSKQLPASLVISPEGRGTT